MAFMTNPKENANRKFVKQNTMLQLSATGVTQNNISLVQSNDKIQNRNKANIITFSNKMKQKTSKKILEFAINFKSFN